MGGEIGLSFREKELKYYFRKRVKILFHDSLWKNLIFKRFDSKSDSLMEIDYEDLIACKV